MSIVKEMIKTAGVNRSTAAELIGVSHQRLANWEKNTPSLEKLNTVAKSLGMVLEIVLGKEQVDVTLTRDVKISKKIKK